MLVAGLVVAVIKTESEEEFKVVIANTFILQGSFRNPHDKL